MAKDFSKAPGKLRRFSDGLSREERQWLIEDARNIKNKAFEKAPKDTFTLSKLITWRQGVEGAIHIVQKNPGPLKPPAVKGKRSGGPSDFNYAEAMRDDNSMGVTWLGPRIRTGDPNYMRTAALWGMERYKAAIKAFVAKQVKLQ